MSRCLSSVATGLRPSFAGPLRQREFDPNQSAAGKKNPARASRVEMGYAESSVPAAVSIANRTSGSVLYAVHEDRRLGPAAA